MRGKARKFSGLVANNGITPAHAGKSCNPFFKLDLPRDHPRTCGEKTQEVTKYKAYDILHA